MERLLREAPSHFSIHPAAVEWIGEYLHHNEPAYDTIVQPRRVDWRLLLVLALELYG
jgi:hypothetical protein